MALAANRPVSVLPSNAKDGGDNQSISIRNPSTKVAPKAGHLPRKSKELRQKAESSVLYHCRKIAGTVDALSEQWDKLVSEELLATDKEVVARIENEKHLIVELVQEVIATIESLIDSIDS